MLPFLQPKKVASVIMEVRKPDGSEQPSAPEKELSLAKRLIDAVHSKDEAAVAKILESLNASDEVQE